MCVDSGDIIEWNKEANSPFLFVNRRMSKNIIYWYAKIRYRCTIMEKLR